MKALVMELGPWEINVNAICPSGMGKVAQSDYDPSQWGTCSFPTAAGDGRGVDRPYGKLNLFKTVGRSSSRRWQRASCGSSGPFAPDDGLDVPNGCWICRQARRLRRSGASREKF